MEAQHGALRVQFPCGRKRHARVAVRGMPLALFPDVHGTTVALSVPFFVAGLYHRRSHNPHPMGRLQNAP